MNFLSTDFCTLTIYLAYLPRFCSHSENTMKRQIDCFYGLPEIQMSCHDLKGAGAARLTCLLQVLCVFLQNQPIQEGYMLYGYRDSNRTL